MCYPLKTANIRTWNWNRTAMFQSLKEPEDSEDNKRKKDKKGCKECLN
jgi:hypothetical protein